MAQQRVVYSYDLAGNRIEREIVIDPQIRTTEDKIVEYTEKIAEASLHIYPNPTEGLLKIELRNIPEKQKIDIRLYDMKGNLILNRNDVSSPYEIDINDRPSGIYLLKVVSGELKTEWKIIKK